MKLNQFTDLGLRTLIYLTQPDRGKPFTIGEMAVELKVSANHLVKVVHFMGKQGWVVTTRGRNGGVSLAKNASEYKLGTTVKILEEKADSSTELVNCHSPVCVLNNNCNLRSILFDAVNYLYEFLEKYTLEDAVKNPQTLINLRIIETKSI